MFSRWSKRRGAPWWDRSLRRATTSSISRCWEVRLKIRDSTSLTSTYSQTRRSIMIRRREFALAGLSTVALAALGSAGEKPPDAREPSETVFDHCAKACSDCHRACEGCATHCGRLMARGAEQHLDTLMA